MAILTKAQLQADNSASFADNNTQAITPQILRAYNGNIIDTLVDSLVTGSFANTAVSNDFTAANQFTSISASSFVSASAFVGDGSKITGVTASISMPISEEGVLLGNATQLNFSGSNITAVLNAGIATISVTVNNLVTTSSFNAFTASTNTFTASQVTKDLTLATYTASVDTKFTAVGVSTASLNTFTSSQETKNNTLATYTASVNNSISALNQFTASQSTSSIVTSITELNSFTSSQNTKNSTLAIYTASIDTKFTAVGSSTASLNAFTASFTFNTASFVTTSSFQTYTSSIDTKFVAVGASTSSLNTFSASALISINALNTFTASQSTASLVTSITNLNTFTSSQLTINSAIGVSTSSLNTFSSSVLTQLNTLANVTSSLISKTGSYATTGSNTFIGDQTITGNITAFSASFTYLQTIFESSSVIYSSGSNQFGDELSDTQTLSGSVKVQGSLTINGTPVQTSSVDISALNSFTASQYVSNSFFATTGSNSFNGNQTITGNLLVSGSNPIDVNVVGRVSITGPASGETPRLFISSSDGAFTELSRNFNQINTTNVNGGLDAYGQIFANTSSVAGQYIGVYDDPGFNTDVEVSILVSNSGSTFNDWDNGITFGYVPFMTLTPNTGNNPSPVMTRGLQVTGSTQVQNFTASLQQGFTYVGNASGITTTVATSSFATPIPTGTISGSQQITSLGFVSSSVTASSLVTASVSLNTITFTKGDASTFSITVNTGSAVTTDISALNSFTSSQETKDTTLSSVTSSLNTATASLFTSASLGLTTASFSGNTLTFTKGNGTTFGIVIPDVSGSGGTFATLGANTFTGSQTISSSLNVSGSANFVGGDVNFTDQGRNINIDVDRTIIKGQKQTLISSSLDIQGSLTASLANGYAWVGDATNHNVLVATSSFATNVSNLATTGSNTFRGNQNISGSLTVTGSAFGNVVALSITSNTASMDLNLGNYFTLTLAGTATTHISASNVQPGVSATLVITTGTNSSASLAPTMLQPSGSSYSATNGSGKKDVLSIVAVASGVPFVVSTKNMI